MVKRKNTTSKPGSENPSTAVPGDKTKTISLDHDLSPLVCRKLKFDNKRKPSLIHNSVKSILSHQFSTKSIKFLVEWDSDPSENILPSLIKLPSAKKHCPGLLIDYLISKLKS